MKILIAGTNSEMFSGATRCMVELAQGLIEKQNDVVVLLPREGDVESALKNLGITYFVIHEYHSWYTSDRHRDNAFRLKRMLNLKAINKAKRLIKEEHIDLVHVNALTGYTAGKAAIELNIPVVWHIREFMEEDLNISFYDQLYSLNLLNQASRCVAISQPIFDKWTKLLRTPIVVIHDGVPVNNYYIGKKTRHPVVNVLLYGRIVPGKGQLFFVKAAVKALKSIRVPCHFSFAGKIENQDYYQACVREIQVSECTDEIEYLGEISDVKRLLINSDIVCVCSKMEGFGRVTVEAMLGKCLVVGADTGATREIIEDKKNGLLYHEGDLDDFVSKLVTAVNDFDKYEPCICAGQSYALNNFTAEKNVTSILQVYDEILSESSS